MQQHSLRKGHASQARQYGKGSPPDSGVSRRELLTALAAAGAGLILPAGQLWSQTASPGGSGDPPNRS